MNTIRIPEILLPKDADMSAWAVNACDQFTSDKHYWERAKSITAGKRTTLDLIFPEIYLKDDPEARIAAINRKMLEYVSDGVFKSFKGLVFVERTTASGTRRGIVLSIDLEDYSFKEGAKTPVRSTEATILERIPPRVKIREGAPLELPHAMLLYSDDKNAVINCAQKGEMLYDFDLMLGGGHVKGYKIENADEVVSALYSVAKELGGEKLLFAVGDGNHSLATAKTCWEKVKATLTEEQQKTHPARFALAEAVNVFDGALNFEPIHRLIKCDDPQKFIKGLKTCGKNSAYTVLNGKKEIIPFCGDIPEGIRALDKYIAEYIAENGGEVDYIHGEKEICAFTKDGGAGVILPSIKKSEFFELIMKGVLPRKTFSMGEGEEKRYYIEAKLIK